MSSSKPDKPLDRRAINHPSHYNQGKIEVIDFISDQKLNFNMGCVIKYLCRAGKKEKTDPMVDLAKAKWYLEREISDRTLSAHKSTS